MKCCIKYMLINIILTLGLCFNINVYAKTVTPDEIDGPAYVIGTHIFNREVNESTGYDGRLTTNLIMFASQTIDSSNLNDMIIYYKTATGKWINGLNGGNVTLPNSFEINYTNLQLEDVNNTVKKPKNPILYLEGPKYVDYENKTFKYQLTMFIDDIDDISNKVDGVEIIMTANGRIHDLDYKYGEKFGYIFPTTEVDDIGIEGLIAGRRYHSDYLEIENKFDGFVSVAVKAYVLDANGKKTYSDTILISINPDTNFPSLEIVNEYSNPEYISNDDGYFTYRLGIKYPEPWAFHIEPSNYAYILHEETDGTDRQIGIYELNGKTDITIPENSVRIYSASLGYYDDNNKFTYFTPSEVYEYIIDTRSLTTPTLKSSVNSDGGLYLKINSSFYQEQDEKSLDYQVEGTEIYGIYYLNGVKKYKLLEEKFDFVHLSSDDFAGYVARVYATSAAGKKVYSEFSNEVTKNKYGEVTGDDIVDIGDAIKIRRYIEDLETLSEQEKINADVNGDGYIDYVDHKLILYFDAGYYKNTLPEKQIKDYIIYGDTLDTGFISKDSPDSFAVIERHLNGTVLLEGQALKNSDINGDGKVDGIDKALMFGYINDEVSFDLPSPTPIIDYELYGDINEDGVLTSEDRVKLSQFLNNETTISDQAFKNADMNSDNFVNDDDYNLLNSYINLHSDLEIIYPLYKSVEKYTITYELFDGQATNINEYSIISGDIKLKNPTKKGFNFIGWTGSNGDVPQKDLVIPAGTTGDLQYDANYEAVTYIIKYHSNSETAVGSMEDETFVYSNEDDLYYSVVNPLFTNNGYKFHGWALTPNATTNIMCPPIKLYKTEIADYANEDNVLNLYAIWN